jgi:hypothetical protein
VFVCSLRSLRCSLGCRRLRRIWRNGKALFRHLLLQIGGANIANPPPMLCASALSLIQRGAVEIATLESRAVHLSHLEQTDDVFVRPQP